MSVALNQTPLETESHKMKVIQAKIRSGNVCFSRRAHTPDGDFFIANSDRPEVSIGDLAVIAYEPADQFAKLCGDMFQTKNGEYWQFSMSSEAKPGCLAGARPGGGFVVSIPIADVKNWDAKYPENQYKYGPVGFEGEYVCHAYVGMRRWNGWAIPCVDREQLLRFLASQDKLNADYPNSGTVTGKLDGTVLHVCYNDPDNNDDGQPTRETIEPAYIKFNGADVLVWEIGLGLIWDECDEPKAAGAAQKFVAIGPDEIPLCPEAFDSHVAAMEYVAKWCKQYEEQGYYSSVDGRIPIAALAACVVIRPVEDGEDVLSVPDKVDKFVRAVLDGISDVEELDEVSNYRVVLRFARAAGLDEREAKQAQELILKEFMTAIGRC